MDWLQFCGEFTVWLHREQGSIYSLKKPRADCEVWIIPQDVDQNHMLANGNSSCSDYRRNFKGFPPVFILGETIQTSTQLPFL